MPIPAKPAAPALQTTGPAADTAAHARCFVPITEPALPLADLVSGVTSAPFGVGASAAIVSAAFAGTTANLLRVSGKAAVFAGRGVSVSPTAAPYCVNMFVAARLADFANGFNIILDAAVQGGIALCCDGSGSVAVLTAGFGATMAEPGLTLVAGHDHLIYFGYTFDGVNTCTSYYSLYDFTAGAALAATLAARVGSTDVYTSSGAAGSINQVAFSGGFPADLALGSESFGDQADADFYAAYFSESSSPADLWTQTQITELVADLLRSARPPAAPSGRFRHGPLGRLRSR